MGAADRTPSPRRVLTLHADAVRLLDLTVVVELLYRYIRDHRYWPRRKLFEASFPSELRTVYRSLVTDALARGFLHSHLGYLRITPAGWLLIQRRPIPATLPDRAATRRYRNAIKRWAEATLATMESK